MPKDNTDHRASRYDDGQACKRSGYTTLPWIANIILHRVVQRALHFIATALPLLAPNCDALLVQYRTQRALGYKPDLRNPRTFNEKLAWRILHDRNPLIPLTTDKISVRDYVAAKVGPEVLVPLLGVYERSSDIPWEALPNCFVLKASHGSGMNLLVRDKAGADRAALLRQADGWLRKNYYENNREWAYRNIRPRLLVEELLLEEDGRIPVDLKFHIFHGRAAVVQIHIDRFGEHSMNSYDAELNFLPFQQEFLPPDPTYVPPPEVREMAHLAERLAEDFDYARIDLYLVRGKVKFGEITHYDGAAQSGFTPREYDRILGDMWRLQRGSDLRPQRSLRFIRP